MKKELQHIPQRIRELREILDITVQDMADKLKVNVCEYENYENGSLDIPISQLFEMSVILDVDMTVLLTGEMPRMNTYSVVRKNDGVKVERYKGYSYSSLAYNFIGKIMEPLLVELSADQTLPSSVTHKGQEFNYVVQGKIKIGIGEHEYVLNEGDSIYFDPRLPHYQSAVTDKARFLTVICEF